MALVSTFNSMTEDFFTSKKITDIVSKGHPTLEQLLKRAKPGGGKNCVFDVEYNLCDGGFRTLTGQMTWNNPEIVTQGTLPWRDLYVGATMEKLIVSQNKNDPRALASYFDTRVNNAVKSLKQRYMAPAVFTAQTGQAYDSLVDAVSDSASYAGILKSELPSWTALVAEGAYAQQASTALSPTIENVRKIIRLGWEYNQEPYSLIVVDGGFFDCLREQAGNHPNADVTSASGDLLSYGKRMLHIDGVPVVSDPNFTVTAWDGTGDTRALAGGSQALFINFDYFDFMYLPEWWLKWDPEGWRTPLDYTQYQNQLHAAGNIVCRSRKHQARMYGVDLSQDIADWTVMADARLNLSQFAIPAAA